MPSMTTLVTLVGPRASATLDRVSAANVSIERTPELSDNPTEAAAVRVDTWRRALRRGSIYTLTDCDPLGGVVEAWSTRLTGGEDHLELSIGLVPHLPAPDFYLVDPAIGDPRIHWFAHHLRDLAPTRVVIIDLEPGSVLDLLGNFPPGPQLPQLTDLAAGARSYVPVPELSAQPLTTPRGRSLATGAASPASRHASTTSSTSL